MDPDVEEDLRGLLRMADSTGSGAFDESAESSIVFSTNCSRYYNPLLLTVVLPHDWVSFLRTVRLLPLLYFADAGKLNYLEFLSLFDFQDPRSLTHQAMLDLLCFQVSQA